MLITAKEMESGFRGRLAAMEPAEVSANIPDITKSLRAMGMYDLARDLQSGGEDALSRLYSCFGVSLYGGIVIEDLSPAAVEFERIYGLNDPLTNEPGREISFTVRDINGRFPVDLKPESVSASFSVDTKDGGMTAEVSSCVYDRQSQSTRCTLDVRVSPECFQTEGVFVMHINVRADKAAAPISAAVTFTVKNSFPDFSLEDITGGIAVKPLPARISGAGRGRRAGTKGKSGRKEIYTDRKIIQTKQRSVRLSFDKQGQGEPVVLCSNGAFKAGIPSRSAVNISFRLPIYRAMEKKLSLIGVNTRIPPETSVWVEWEDFVMIYNVQYKGFLVD